MAPVIEELSERIASRSPKNGEFLLVAIDGRGGSGKSERPHARADTVVDGAAPFG